MTDPKPQAPEAANSAKELDAAELEAVRGGKTSLKMEDPKTSSLQVGPAPAKPIDSGGTSTTQI